MQFKSKKNSEKALNRESELDIEVNKDLLNKFKKHKTLDYPNTNTGCIFKDEDNSPIHYKKVETSLNSSQLKKEFENFTSGSGGNNNNNKNNTNFTPSTPISPQLDLSSTSKNNISHDGDYMYNNHKKRNSNPNVIVNEINTRPIKSFLVTNHLNDRGRDNSEDK
jgi:hypothetical protein